VQVQTGGEGVENTAGWGRFAEKKPVIVEAAAAAINNRLQMYLNKKGLAW
jgi:hypothetical protein